jgi:hypothetical protein
VIKFSVFLLISSFGLSSFAADSFLLTERLKANGFTCTSETNGDVCTISKINTGGFKYDQPVAILVPKNVRRPQNTLLHLHGFRGVCESADTSAKGMADEFNFLQQMKDANATNSVMVFPMSTGKETTYQASLVPQFSKFTAWVNSQLQPTTDHWTVSGHSGAGSVISSALSSNPSFAKKVDSVMLLDATYGIPGHLSQWQNIAKSNPNMKITSIYRKGTATQSGSDLLASRGLARSQASKSSRHCLVPTTEYASLLAKSSSSGSIAGISAKSSSAPQSGAR